MEPKLTPDMLISGGHERFLRGGQGNRAAAEFEGIGDALIPRSSNCTKEGLQCK